MFMCFTYQLALAPFRQEWLPNAKKETQCHQLPGMSFFMRTISGLALVIRAHTSPRSNPIKSWCTKQMFCNDALLFVEKCYVLHELLPEAVT